MKRPKDMIHSLEPRYKFEQECRSVLRVFGISPSDIRFQTDSNTTGMPVRVVIVNTSTVGAGDATQVYDNIYKIADKHGITAAVVPAEAYHIE